MFLKSIKLSNFLSFAESEAPVEMQPLNVLIGPNGSGKSNFLEALNLLHFAPNASSNSNMLTEISRGGGIEDWRWKGCEKDNLYMKIDAIFSNPLGELDLRYVIQFTQFLSQYWVSDERIEDDKPQKGHDHPNFYFQHQDGKCVLTAPDGTLEMLGEEEKSPISSILAKRKDPLRYPQITYLANMLTNMRFYREWHFGSLSFVRLPQRADLPTDRLEADARNMYMVLGRILKDASAKRRFLELLNNLYPNINDLNMDVYGGTVKVMFQEGDFGMSANRLSDGTLRFLYLLIILCDPNPQGPLVCIEEPELGLHPDVLPIVADLLVEASERMQLVVTTHSDILVDAMTETPEAILVTERADNGTQLRRLDKIDLEVWLNKYRLGEIWTRGQIGGVRW